MNNPTLLILAAGMGSRYGGLKVDDPIGPHGQTIINYSIHDASQAGFSKFFFVIRPEIDDSFRRLVHERLGGTQIEVHFIYQKVADLPRDFRVPPGRIKPWGTTHAILSAAGTIHEPFGVINVDEFYGADSYRSLANHLRAGTSDQAMVSFVLRNTLPEFEPVARAVCHVNHEGFLEQINELKSVEKENSHIISTDKDGLETVLHGDELVSMNMWGFTPPVFDMFAGQFKHFLERSRIDENAECCIPDTISELVKDGKLRVKVLHCADSWFGLTYRADHTHAAANIMQLTKAGYYPQRL
jgi:dTDP-glucose pyrophosphorylase